MMVTAKTQLRVCDICRRPLGGEAHRFGEVCEVCGGCWAEPTKDMVDRAVHIVNACRECRSDLRRFKDGFALLYSGDHDCGVAVFETLEEAKECALEELGDREMFDIFDHGVRTHAYVFSEVRFEERQG